MKIFLAVGCQKGSFFLFLLNLPGCRWVAISFCDYELGVNVTVYISCQQSISSYEIHGQ